jgi:hypothetical protein
MKWSNWGDWWCEWRALGGVMRMCGVFALSMEESRLSEARLA